MNTHSFKYNVYIIYTLDKIAKAPFEIKKYLHPRIFKDIFNV